MPNLKPDAPETEALAERVATLSDPQKEILRLVFRRKTSKQIARILDVKLDTVNARIASAKRKLDAQDRGEAADLLAIAEGDNAYQSVAYRPLVIGEQEPFDQTGPATEAEEIAEAQAAFHRSSRPMSWFDWFVPRGNPDALSPRARITWMLWIAVMAMVTLMVGLAVAQGASKFSQSIWPIEPSNSE